MIPEIYLQETFFDGKNILPLLHMHLQNQEI